MGLFDRVLALVFSLCCLGTGLFISLAHPLAPLLSTALFCSALAVFLWQGSLGLLVLPVLLPVLNFSPWSGWLMVDEFDLLVLSVVAAGYFRMSLGEGSNQLRRIHLILIAIAILFTVRSAAPLSPQDLSGFSDYLAPLNGLRVGKSLLWLALLFPLFAFHGENSPHKISASSFFRSCLVGSGIVVLAIVWERSFYPGLFDFSTPYRTVALFWEMHIGGAALDAYLVLIAPLLVWAWRSARSLLTRLALGGFVLIFVYCCLTTYSRGVIASILASVLFLVAVLAWLRLKGRQAPRPFNLTGGIVLVLVVFEVVAVLAADTYLNERLVSSERDLGGRLQHWARGIALLKTPQEWLFGIGLGKLPARMAQGETGLAIPGAIYPNDLAGQKTMVLAGPKSSNSFGMREGLYFLSQRIDLTAGQGYRFAMDAFSDQKAELLIKVCAQHLLYPADCLRRIVPLDSSGWQHRESILPGALLKAGEARLSGHGVVLLAMLTPGTKADLAHLYLSDGPDNLLRNAQFRDGSASWFPVARAYFLPWHIDNFYLEILIETGLFGLLGFFALVVTIVRNLSRACDQGNVFAPYLLASIAGLLALGLVVSVLDMPRMTILFGLFLISAWQTSSCDSIHPKLHATKRLPASETGPDWRL